MIIALVFAAICAIFGSFLLGWLVKPLPIIILAIIFGGLYLVGWAVWPSPPERLKFATIRPAYSSRQVLQVSSFPGNYNSTLNLDNVAELRLTDPFNGESVTLGWFSSPPVTIAQPQPGKPYEVPGGGASIQVGGPGIEIGALTMMEPPLLTIKFDFLHPVELIRVGERIFRVALVSATDKADAKAKIVMFFEYEFAISEEEPTAENRTAAISLETPLQSASTDSWTFAEMNKPIGKIRLQIPGTVNGKPNLVNLRAGTKAFLFDPTLGVVRFYMATNAGKSVDVRLLLSRAPAAAAGYSIAFAWDNSKGASLRVDDKSTSDGL